MDDLSWVKVSISLFDNKKIKHLRTLPDGDRIVLFWIMLITLAGHCNYGGKIFFMEDIPYTPKTLSVEAHIDEAVIQLALESFKMLKMIDIDADGFIYILNWAEYQSEDKLSELREYNRLAKQRSRAKQKALASANVNDLSMTCQHKEEESDIDTNTLSFFPRVRASNGIEIPEEVVLSDLEIQLLSDELTKEEFEHYITAVADAEKSGKHYTKISHYQAIIKMAQMDRKKADAIKKYKSPQKKAAGAPSFDLEKIEKMMATADCVI